MTQPIKLLLAIPHLGGGGAERVTAQLARHLDPALFEIHLVLITEDASGAAAPPDWVTVHRLHARRVRSAAFKLLSLIRRLQPRIILSNMAHLNFLVLVLKPFLPRQTLILVRQNTTASAAAKSAVSRFLYRHLYPRADLILCQSQSMADDLSRHFGIAADKLAVLYNPTDLTVPSHAPPRNSAPTLLTVGRLSPEKGIDLLLHAVAIVRRTHPEMQLTILGIGTEAASLRKLVHTLALTSSVHFAGYANPAEYYATSTLFVLPSRYEGMPNALLEAAAAGLPIMATPCSAGLIELLKEAPGTWLAAQITAEALAESILTALSSPEVQAGHRYRHPFLAPCETRTAIAEYESVLRRTARLRIAMLIPTIDQIGGAERQVLLLAKALAARDWRVTVIALSGEGTAQQEDLYQSGVAYMSLGMRKAWIDPRGWLRYLRWARKNKPDILHSHLPHATYFARLVRLLAPVHAVVDTIHTSKPGPPSRRWTYRLTHWLADQVTCVSRPVMDAILTAKMVSKAIVIPNGIELPSNLLRSRSQSAHFRWIAVGRLAPVKDYPTLLRAFALLDPALLDPTARLTILGTGPAEQPLRNLAVQLAIENRIHFAGFQSEVHPWLTDADAFVLNSLWEGLPVSVLEASAASLPVVATDGAGTRSALIPNQTGLLVPVGDHTALAKAMSQIMAMPLAQRQAMGDAGREFVEQSYSLDQVVTQWETLYQSLLKR
jgi:glycosyltransferase involved in cell wall biosynthesis